MNKKLSVICILCLMSVFACKVSDVKKPLEGKWQIMESQVSGPERYLPDAIEFSSDGTASLSDFPGIKFPFKTELSKEERELLKKNYPELEGKNVLLILLDPSQHDWLQHAVAYQYIVTEHELSLRPVIDAKTTKFRRVTQGR